MRLCTIILLGARRRARSPRGLGSRPTGDRRALLCRPRPPGLISRRPPSLPAASSPFAGLLVKGAALWGEPPGPGGDLLVRPLRLLEEGVAGTVAVLGARPADGLPRAVAGRALDDDADEEVLRRQGH